MQPARDLVASASAALKELIEDVNRLNVFPVPDGDTGTNMSLTMDAVVAELAKLTSEASASELCHAITHGSLMGARGNSGVILSQILRGLCEGIDGSETVDAQILSMALARARDVAYQAVRKPVEGTMLTVVRECADAAATAAEQGLTIELALRAVSVAAFDSVRRTPELLPVLKENGVVDAGGYGLAILAEGFAAAATGEKVVVADVSSAQAPLQSVEPVDYWDDDEYLYCTEFLLLGEDIDREAIHDFVASVGGSELVVGDAGSYKVHVHTNDPGSVLAHVTGFGEVAEVHINNMRRQQEARDSALRSEGAVDTPRKPVGFVSVAAGSGLTAILQSLGVDVVVSGGQTMNPSTQDLLDAIARVPADKVVVLPNNKNILLAATAAASVAGEHVAVVPTRSVPQAFSALLAFDGTEDFEQLVAEMTDAATLVRTGEVTTAVKDAKAKVGEIVAGQVIGIVDDEDIEIVGDDVVVVAAALADTLIHGDSETVTLLAGEQLDDAGLEAIAELVGARHPDLSVETHRGEQPLYPLIMSVE
jgi:DAK2 domain fusion protein YloV